MLHHVSLPVRNIKASKALYDDAMEVIGYLCIIAVDTAVGYGVDDSKDKLLLTLNPDTHAASEGFHRAFATPPLEADNDFRRAALESGPRDNGKRDLLRRYGPDYHGPFVIDLDCDRFEAIYN